MLRLGQERGSVLEAAAAEAAAAGVATRQPTVAPAPAARRPQGEAGFWPEGEAGWGRARRNPAQHGPYKDLVVAA